MPTGFAFDAWHTLSEISTGTTFEYLIDGTLYLTQPTTAGNDLLSAMVQGYNFDGTGNHSYSVDWDNVTASAIPEPATSAFIAAVGVLILAFWSRRRVELKRAGAAVFHASVRFFTARPKFPSAAPCYSVVGSGFPSARLGFPVNRLSFSLTGLAFSSRPNRPTPPSVVVRSLPPANLTVRVLGCHETAHSMGYFCPPNRGRFKSSIRARDGA